MTHSRPATSPKAWRKRTGGIDLDLPSGNTCKVKRPGMEKLLKAGILPDSMTPIALEHIRRAESGGRPDPDAADTELERQIMEEVLQDPSQIGEIFLSFDRVTAMCVVEPKVVLHVRERLNEDGSKFLDEKGRPVWDEIPPEERISSENPETIEVDGEIVPNPYYASEEEEPLYTDEVDGDDKQYIFQFVVGGSSDLAQFPGESGADVAVPQPGAVVPGPSVGAGRHL